MIAPRFYFYLRKVEGDGQSWHVATDEPARAEDFAQLIMRLKAEYKVNESEIARRIDVTPATVNSWVRRTRGGSRGPNRDTLRNIAAAFPKFTEDEIFAAVGRKTPGPLTPDATQRIIDLYAGLTAEQQEMTEVQMRALNEANRSA